MSSVSAWGAVFGGGILAASILFVAAPCSAQVALLQDEVESLSHKVKEIEVAQDFDRKLLGHEKRE